MSIPSAGINNYIGAGSFRGASFEGLKELNSRWCAGWLLGWNVFYEKRVKEVYEYDNLTLTGTQFRYMNLFPLLIRGMYEPFKTEGIRALIGAGTGFTPDISRVNVGLHSFRNTGWHYSLAPEMDIIVPVGSSSLLASLRYIYGVRTKEMDRISYFSINLGILWGY